MTATLTNSSEKPNMEKQSENLHTNHIIVDDKFKSAKEKCGVRSLRETPTSLKNISMKFVTDNRAHDSSSSGEDVMNLEAIKKVF